MISSEFSAASCVVMCHHQRSGKCRFPEDFQRRSTTNDYEYLYAAGGKWRNSARKSCFWPIWPKSQMRNPKSEIRNKSQIRKSKSKMTALTPGPSLRTGEGSQLPSPPAPLAGHHVGHHVPMVVVVVEERGAKRHHVLPSTKWARQRPKQTDFGPRMTRLCPILTPCRSRYASPPKNTNHALSTGFSRFPGSDTPAVGEGNILISYRT